MIGRSSFGENRLRARRRVSTGVALPDTRFGAEEAPGLSVFYKDDAGQIFHTYSAYARGLDPLVGTYQFLDLVPKGRDEDGLTFTMAWVRHRDKYADNYVVIPKANYEKPREEGA